jgi:hypothetical protein
MTEIPKQVDNLTEHVALVDRKITDVQEGKFTQKMIDTVKEITKEEVHIQPPELAEEKLEELKGILESRDKEQIAELEERMKRKHNLMLFHLPESKTKDREARLKEEKEQINKLLTEVKVDHKLLEYRRIGRFIEANKPEEQKHRPVRLTFSSETTRDEVLKAYHRVRKEPPADDQENIKLCMTLTLRKDLTPQERKEEDKLFEELKAKRQQSVQSGDEIAHWIRRNGRVVNVGRYPRQGEGDR